MSDARTEARFTEREQRANAAWTAELAAANTIEKVETIPTAICATCERNIDGEDRAAHEGHDIIDTFCGEQTDNLAMFLAKHLPLAMKDGSVLCMCGAPMLDGPVFHRVHVATVVRAFLAAGPSEAERQLREALAFTTDAIAVVLDGTTITVALPGAASALTDAKEVGRAALAEWDKTYTEAK